jgi:hypothetical protein
VALVAVADTEVQLLDLEIFQQQHLLKEIMAELQDQENKAQVVAVERERLEIMDQQVQQIMVVEMVV